jgi:hypothetical protein
MTSFRRRAAASFRPSVEMMEGRCVPTTVTNLMDSGPGSLRQAILDTAAGGTVDFQADLTGTIILTTGELAINRDLTIAGPGADVITVSGNHTSPVFNTAGAVAISGLTIADGYNTSFGGGITNLGTLTLVDSIIRDNVAADDAGVNSFGTLTVTHCIIADNATTADGFGGGISTGFGMATITNTLVTGNSATNGAGIVSFGTTLLDSSTVSDNTATVPGPITFGGGLYVNTGTTTVINSTISGNSTLDVGGGIINFGTLNLTSTTVSDNSAGSVVLGGGGLYNLGNSPTLRNTIIAANTAPRSPDVGATVHSLGHNLIGDGTGGSGYLASDLVGTSANPIDPLLRPLQDNGGPTETMALLPGSPAIGAGDPTDAPEWDQRGPGFPRVVNGLIDIGAFEVQPTVTAPTVTCSVAQSLLWPPNHQLVDVGLGVTVDPPDANVHVLVYGNDNASPSDAANIGPGTLQLRSERQGNGSGRVYLIVVTATNSGGTSFDVCAVAVPHDHSPGSMASALQQAAAAEAYYREFETAPPGFQLLGEGPDDGGGTPSPGRSGRSAIPGDILGLAVPAPATPPTFLHQAPLFGVDNAGVPAEHSRSIWASLPVDGYFATAYEESLGRTLPVLDQAGWGEANAPVFDLMLQDDWLVA